MTRLLFVRQSRYRHVKEYQEAFAVLVDDKIIITELSNDVRYYLLDFVDKSYEIRHIIRQEPFIERAKKIKPIGSYFDGYDEIFTKATERAWPNRGMYYYCTKQEDDTYWKVVIVTKPKAKPTTIVLGSLINIDSKISKMWKSVLETWNNNSKEPIYKKMAEDNNQKLWSNNRQPSVAGFSVFEYLGWIKEQGKKRNSIYYKIIDEDAHNKFLRDRGIL